MKILVIGGGWAGIGKDVVDYFAPDSFNASKSNGFDITIPEDRREIARKSLSMDAVLNHAYTGDMSQYYMLKELYTTWVNEKKKGYLFHTGTYSTYSMQWNVNSSYPDIKGASDELARKISKRCENNKTNFRCTNIRPGMLDTAKSRLKPHWKGSGVRGDDFARIIEFLYNLPEDLCIPQIVMAAKNDD
ncbi:MAG: hypothetical protein ACTSX1_13800 [Candidatus Heimdallarchaeaceae archaeon]